MVDGFTRENSLVVIPQDKIQEIQKTERETFQKELPNIVQGEIEKAKTLERNEAYRFAMPGRINAQTNPDRKVGSDISFGSLRRMAQLYPIARACINRRIRQITQLGWDITTVDDVEGEEGFETQIDVVKQFFKQPMGHKTRLRELLTLMVDDVLTLDAVCFELQRTRGKDFMHLIPVDPATIALKVTETGATPEPPEDAYRQIIQGTVVAEFTTDEMIYEAMGNRSYNPYGFAPLESLIIQAESAIMGAIYNLSFFKEGNVPAGFLTLDEKQVVTKTQVEEYQMWFDALVAGDPRFFHRLKVLPGGSTYTPAQKPEDMAFERFELWLAGQTCAVFDVQPQDIGLTIDINKATAKSQSEIGRERGLVPLANFIKEIFDDLIQTDLGFENLQWQWTDINPVNKKEEADIAAIEIGMGAKSVDEYRISQGLEPVGLGAYIKNGNQIVLVDDIVTGKYSATQEQNQEGNEEPEDKTEDPEKMELAELKKWRKALYNDLDKGRAFRTEFPSKWIHPETHKQIEEGLQGVSNRHQIKLLFDQFLDSEVKAAMELLKLSSEMRKLENAVSA